DLLAVLVLEADVGRAGRVVADEDGAEPWRDPDLAQRGHLFGQFGAHGSRDGGPVQNRSAHQCLKCLSPVNTMAMPCSSAAAMTSSSRMEPPGWTTVATPASLSSSMLS